MVVKFADDITVIGLISGGEEDAYRREVAGLVEWCQENNLSLHTKKTKEMIIDTRRRGGIYQPLFIKEAEVERVTSFKFLGINITEELTWTLNITDLAGKARQRLYFLRKLRKFGMPSTMLSSFYRATIESIISQAITVWYGSSTVRDRESLQRVIKAAQRITGAPLPSLADIYNTRVFRRADKIIKDYTHLLSCFFTLLPSGRRYRSLAARTTRLKDSFLPNAIGLVTKTQPQPLPFPAPPPSSEPPALAL